MQLPQPWCLPPPLPPHPSECADVARSHALHPATPGYEHPHRAPRLPLLPWGEATTLQCHASPLALCCLKPANMLTGQPDVIVDCMQVLVCFETHVQVCVLLCHSSPPLSMQSRRHQCHSWRRSRGGTSSSRRSSSKAAPLGRSKCVPAAAVHRRRSSLST